MMRPAILFAFTLCAALGWARELPWMGVSLNAVKAEQAHHLSLPEGVGFEVSEIIPEGPLAKAGGKNGDLWWKFDGQILVNKGQMVVLLRSKSPGDQVKIEFFRESQLHSLVLTLGDRDHRPYVPVSFQNEEGEEDRMLAKREKVARVELDGRELSLEAEGKKWRFKIREKDTTVLSALVSDQDIDEKIPVKWHQSFLILKMTLATGSGRAEGPGSRKVRYIPRRKSPAESD